MKKSIFLILNVLIVFTLAGQTNKLHNSADDPFCRMVRTIWSIDVLSFNSRFSEKQVFENDTVTELAKVIVKKKGNTFTLLQIIPDSGNKELLFCNDSAWLADHGNKTLICLGSGIDCMTHNHLSEFFPFSIYNIDTTIYKVEPFWKIIDSKRDFTVISLDITNTSPDLSDIRVEFTMSNSDHLLRKTLQESDYMKADKLFQEVGFSGYSFPPADQVKIPGYFSIYKKDFSMVQKTGTLNENKSEESAGEIYLKDIELFDLERKSFSLPQDGLIFLDLWYVGCPPCMKSAPVIEQLYHELGDKVYFFSINETDQDTSKINHFKEKMGITFPVLLGGSEKLAQKINGRGSYPVFILLEAESGKVLWKMEGYSENLEYLINEVIRQNL